jgi:hypothetical protein
MLHVPQLALHNSMAFLPRGRTERGEEEREGAERED